MDTLWGKVWSNECRDLVPHGNKEPMSSSPEHYIGDHKIELNCFKEVVQVVDKLLHENENAETVNRTITDSQCPIAKSLENKYKSCKDRVTEMEGKLGKAEEENGALRGKLEKAEEENGALRGKLEKVENENGKQMCNLIMLSGEMDMQIIGKYDAEGKLRELVEDVKNVNNSIGDIIENLQSEDDPLMQEISNSEYLEVAENVSEQRLESFCNAFADLTTYAKAQFEKYTAMQVKTRSELQDLLKNLKNVEQKISEIKSIMSAAIASKKNELSGNKETINLNAIRLIRMRRSSTVSNNEITQNKNVNNERNEYEAQQISNLKKRRLEEALFLNDPPQDNNFDTRDDANATNKEMHFEAEMEENCYDMFLPNCGTLNPNRRLLNRHLKKAGRPRSASSLSILSVGVASSSPSPTPANTGVGRKLRSPPPPYETNKKQKIHLLANAKSPGRSMITRKEAAIASSCSDISTDCIEEDAISSDKEESSPSSSYKGISGVDFNDLLENEFSPRKTLIIDGRATKEYNQWHIKNSHNIPNPQTPENPKLITRQDVMQFFYNHLPSHIVTINLPGHYEKIIIYDDSSPQQLMCQPLIMMLEAISKWNENTKTQIFFLEGGYQYISNHFPELIGESTNEMRSLAPPQDFYPLVSDFPENPDISEEPMYGGIADVLNCFEPYVKSMDETIKNTAAKLDYKRKLHVLEGINLLLKDEESKGFKNYLDKMIDKDLKCQSCYEIFSGVIFQCANGHSICPDCSEKKLTCAVGECRLPFKYGRYDAPMQGHGIKIRTNVLEKLMETTLWIECPNDNGCGKTLMLSEVKGHIPDCLKNRCPAGKKLEEDIKLTSIDLGAVTAELKQSKQSMHEADENWRDLLDKDTSLCLTRGCAEIIYERGLSLSKLDCQLAMTTGFNIEGKHFVHFKYKPT